MADNEEILNLVGASVCFLPLARRLSTAERRGTDILGCGLGADQLS